MIGPSRGVLSRLSNRAYGLAFLLTLVVLVGLSVATFQKRFTPVVMVTLMAARIGNQLQNSSDVKIRGLIVGEVRSITSTGNGASIEMALQPDQVAGIPVNVSARILPKTLFGERYVDLVIPSDPSSKAIAEGDTISQDRTVVAIELERVFDDLLPLLRTVKPEKLAATLNALATALDGRGTQLRPQPRPGRQVLRRHQPEDADHPGRHQQAGRPRVDLLRCRTGPPEDAEGIDDDQHDDHRKAGFPGRVPCGDSGIRQ